MDFDKTTVIDEDVARARRALASIDSSAITATALANVAELARDVRIQRYTPAHKFFHSERALRAAEVTARKVARSEKVAARLAAWAERGRAIFEMRVMYGATGPEVGKHYGIGRQRVDQIVARELRRIHREKKLYYKDEEAARERLLKENT